MAAITADQLELIEDDPRREHFPKVRTILMQLREATEMHGELLTPSLAARILGCHVNQVHTWLGRGRLTRVEIAQCVFIPAAEVERLYEDRKKDLPKGGRGHKQPSLAEVVKLSLKAE